jgi:two-component system, chemotaxis family, chemotaxis protein CheY
MALAVLIVDDSPAMRKFIGRVVRLAGFEDAECVEASDGREALAQLETRSVDVILTDINMPHMNGEALMQELQRNGTLLHTPAVVISTDATRDRVHRMLELGAKGYIAKPFCPEALREKLDGILGEKHAGRN